MQAINSSPQQRLTRSLPSNGGIGTGLVVLAPAEAVDSTMGPLGSGGLLPLLAGALPIGHSIEQGLALLEHGHAGLHAGTRCPWHP